MNSAKAFAVYLVCTFLSAALGTAETHLEQVSSVGLSSSSGASGSYAPTFSADGRYLLFLSYDRNLTTNDLQGDFLNLYAKEVGSGQISLVSRAAAGNGGGNNSSHSASVSSNGQFIAFESRASNLVPNDTNGFKDIFVWDMVSGVTTLVSIGAPGTGNGNGDSSNPIISADGRFVAFESSATNLVDNDTNGLSDVFIRDRLNGTTMLVSAGASGPAGSSYGSFVRSELAGMTPNGKRILFTSTATNLVPGVTNTSGDIYLRDMDTGTIYWASSDVLNRVVPPYRAYNPVMDDAGQRIIFKAAGYGNHTPLLLRYELTNGITQVLANGSDVAAWPFITGDGKLVASEQGSAIGVWDLISGANFSFANNSTRPPSGPVLSRDGTRVAFWSWDSGGVLLVYDRFDGTFRQANPKLNQSASEDLSMSSLSFDSTGDVLAFESSEGNLVTGDHNEGPDVFVFSWSKGSVSLVSGPALALNNPITQGLSYAGPFSLSANGRYVAFSTTDTNIYPGPGSKTNSFNIVVWDTLLKTNVVSSILTNFHSPDGGNALQTNYLFTGGSGDGPVLSLDGSAVFFVSAEPTFSLSWNSNLFALNLQTGRSTWVNRSPSSGINILQTSLNPSVSADGRYIAYQSDLNDIPSNVSEANGAADVFVYDTVLRTNTTISVNTNGVQTGNGPSFNPLINSDGRWVLFQSTAMNLTTNSVPESSTEEYIRDRVASNTFLISVLNDGQPLSGHARTHAFSLNGGVAAFSFSYDGSGLAPLSLVFVYDPYANTNRLICTNCQNPSLDASGRWLAYETMGTAGSHADVYALDLQTGQSTLISVNSSGISANGSSTSPIISSDGRYVVFVSKASDLVPNDNNGFSDVFVRDRVLGKTVLLSMNYLGTGSGNGGSARPALSADGRTVVFQSLATDLSPGDYNQFRDVFLVRLGGQDSDGDGMDDDWEIAYFGNLSRNGSGDSDGDGQTDLQEFRAGTDPTNQGSVLRAITVSGAGSSGVNVLWSSVPGKTYRIQYKDDVSTPGWNELAGLVTATSTTAVKQDTQPAPQRFYRVVLVE